MTETVREYGLWFLVTWILFTVALAFAVLLIVHYLPETHHEPVQIVNVTVYNTADCPCRCTIVQSDPCTAGGTWESPIPEQIGCR